MNRWISRPHQKSTHINMDWHKKKSIDRFVQSVSYHGPSLISLTKAEQCDSEGSPMNFLYSTTVDDNTETKNYFRNKLQLCCPGALEGIHQPQDNHKEILDQSCSHGRIERSIDKSGNEDFYEKMRTFVASKADLLFSMESKRKVQGGVDYVTHPNQEVLDLYANTPPLETFMEVPLHVRRTQLFNCLKEGDIVIGKVSYKRPFGIIITLTMLEFGCNRDFTELDIQALCKSCELESSPEYKDLIDAYAIGDIVRAVIIGVTMEESKVSISLRHSRLPEAYQHLHLGVIDDPEAVYTRLQSNPEGLTYDEHLRKHKGFNNPRSIETLTDLLRIDTSAPCSLLRSFQRRDCPESDFAEPLRKKQSAKWSMETTAKGVEHFKAGNFDAAMKYFEHALQIDNENVEALVARGALCANEGKISAAIKDFRDALAICPTHRNANKYLTATLVEYGIQQEKEGLLPEAAKSFNSALALDSNQRTAKDHLEKIQMEMKLKEEEKAAAKVDKGLKGRFSHVRELILEEQSQAKRKRKLNDRKKKKKSKNIKKKKKKKKRKAGSRVRRRSEHSSGSSLSSCESSDEDEHSRSDSSDNNEEWVEKEITLRTEIEKGEGRYSKREQDRREQETSKDNGHRHETREKRRAALQVGVGHENTGPHPRKSTTERSPSSVRCDSEISKTHKFERVKGREVTRPSPCQRVGREKYVEGELDWKDSKRKHGAVDEQHILKKRKSSERETYKDSKDSTEDEKDPTRVATSNVAVSSFDESLLERELTRIRSQSGKDSHRVSKTSSLDCPIRSRHDKRDTEAMKNYSAQVFAEQRSLALQCKDPENSVVVDKSRGAHPGRWASSVKSWDDVSKAPKGNQLSLVSYADSSDEGNS